MRYLVFLAIFLVGAVVVSAMLVWWGRERILERWREEQQAYELEQIERPAPRERDYVGSNACRGCHADIARHYAEHPKSFSLTEVVADDYAAGEEVLGRVVPLPERQYEIRAADGMVTHHELGFDADGGLIYDQGVPVHYEIGSGRRLKSYLTDRDGFLFLSPLSWDSESGEWRMSPGYETFPHARFENLVTERCVYCHTGRYAVSDRVTTTATPRFEQPPFQEMAIGCEQCHGPGGEHVRMHRARGEEATEDPIVKLSSLAPAQRDAVCNQCHVHGEHQFLRLGRRHDDFRPGDHVGDIWTLFVDALGPRNSDEPFSFSPAEQMQGSRCYLESDRRLGCTTCHDPHRAPDRSDLAGYYRQRCFTCHSDGSCSLPLPQQQAAPAEGSCIACHMPTRNDGPILHATRTDHRLLRNPFEERAPSMDSPAPLPRIFDLADHPLSTVEESRARGLMLTERAMPDRNREYATQAEVLLARSLNAAPGDVPVLNALGLAFALLGRNEESIELLRATTEVDPGRMEAWYELLLANQATGELEAARPPAERLVRLNPWMPEWHGRHAQILAAAGQPEAALQAARRTIELDPSSLPAWAFLETLHGALGNREEAAEARRMLLRLQGERP
jgi:predicted CXXCH cytochrome family protein